VTGTPQPVTPEDLAHFAVVSARYGRHWNATPEENAARDKFEFLKRVIEM